MEGITTAATGYRRPVHWPNTDWERLDYAQRVHALCGKGIPVGLPIHPVGQVHARLEAGRWLAECACCPSAQLVDPADPRFFCVEETCGNGGTRAWFTVVWPTPKTRVSIERAAVALPPDQRNWVHPADLTLMARAHRQLSTLVTVAGSPS